MVWGLVRGLDGLLTNPRGADSMHAASSAEKLNRHHGHEQQQQQQEWGSQLQQPAGTARTKKRWRRRDRQLVQQQPSYSMAKWLSLLTCYSEFQQQLWDGLLWQANCSTVSELWTTVAGSKAAAGAVGIQNKTTPIHEALLERPDEVHALKCWELTCQHLHTVCLRFRAWLSLCSTCRLCRLRWSSCKQQASSAFGAPW